MMHVEFEDHVWGNNYGTRIDLVGVPSDVDGGPELELIVDLQDTTAEIQLNPYQVRLLRLALSRYERRVQSQGKEGKR